MVDDNRLFDHERMMTRVTVNIMPTGIKSLVMLGMFNYLFVNVK